MKENKTIKVYTTSNGAELNISAPSTMQIITATNNKAQHFAEHAKKYRDEAKEYRDSAKYYAEQNTNVTYEFIDNLKTNLENQISTKQEKGNYALFEDLPKNVSELYNDSRYVTNTELENVAKDLELPSQENCAGKFLMTNGDSESWVGISSFQLFDTKILDKILSYEETKGWALQGTYVYKEAIAGTRYGYPDFYAKCLEEYNEATTTETVNGVTVKVHFNGHKFYDIANKTAIDEFFNTMGSAWFYGVDTTNERVFLPRNNYFDQYTSVSSEVGDSVEAGLPSIEHTHNFMLMANPGATNFAPSHYDSATYSGDYTTTINSDVSSIYGNSDTVQPNAVKKLLYICVGNTTNYEGLSDVVNQGMEILEQVNQGIETRVAKEDMAEVPCIVETYINGTSWYRVYSDGWCEQGGLTVVSSGGDGIYTTSFLKPFIDTNYTITATIRAMDHTMQYQSDAFISAISTSSFSGFMTGGDRFGRFWYACGYIA